MLINRLLHRSKMINFCTHGRADLTEQVAYSIQVPVVPGDCIGDVDHVVG